VLNKLMNNVA